MEPANAQNPQPQQTTAPVQNDSSSPTQPPTKPPLSKKILLIGGGGAILLLMVILGLFSTMLQSNKQTTQQPTPTPVKKQSTQTNKKIEKNKELLMLYGAWTSQSSVIQAVNTTTGKNYSIATLPLSIRKITPLNKDTLLYLDQTDTHDYGKRLSFFNIQDREISLSIYAEPNFVINDYLLSPDKKYLTIWENSTTIDFTDLNEDDKSRIYVLAIDHPNVKNLLYDEIITKNTPIHYPRAILNNGSLFTDTFLPKDSLKTDDFGYGMSRVDYDGANKQDIPSMPKDSYGTKPILSDDGKYLLFGSGGDKKTSNEINVLNTQTLIRFQLPNISPDNSYTELSWNPIDGNIFATFQSQATPSALLYNIEKQSPNEITLPSYGSAYYSYIAPLIEGYSLVGIEDTRPSNYGNLGQTYAYAYAQIALLDENTNLTQLPVKNMFIQFITILPVTFYGKALDSLEAH